MAVLTCSILKLWLIPNSAWTSLRIQHSHCEWLLMNLTEKNNVFFSLSTASLQRTWIFSVTLIINFCCYNAWTYAFYSWPCMCEHMLCIACSTCMPICFHFSPKCFSLFGGNHSRKRRYLMETILLKTAKPQGGRLQQTGNVALSEWVQLTFLRDWNMEAVVVPHPKWALESLWVSRVTLASPFSQSQLFLPL